MIEVIESGLLSTLQDEGRFGLTHLGISIGGAADPLSYRLANLLVGNRAGEAAVEMTLKGGVFRFTQAAVFAIAGSDFGPALDGIAVATGRTHRALAGQTLAFGLSRGGARTYLAVAGGIDVPNVLGSRSTLVSAELGPKPLRRGAALPLTSNCDAGQAMKRVGYSLDRAHELLVLPGPDWEKLSADARKAFCSESFAVTEHANRNGIRLSPALAEPLFAEKEGEPLTEGVIWGTVQLPSSGQPVILMNEQGTTGGYPKIAQVILRDRPKLGQLRPRDSVRFRVIAVDEALALWREHVRQVEARGAVPA